MQAEVADLSSGSHLLDHSPRCASGTFSTKFPDPHEILISVERPFQWKIWREWERFLSESYSPRKSAKEFLVCKHPILDRDEFRGLFRGNVTKELRHGIPFCKCVFYWMLVEYCNSRCSTWFYLPCSANQTSDDLTVVANRPYMPNRNVVRQDTARGRRNEVKWNRMLNSSRVVPMTTLPDRTTDLKIYVLALQ